MFFISSLDPNAESQKKLYYVASQKGNFQLAQDGYFYIREKIVRDKTYWRCVEYTSKAKCHSRIHTIKEIIVRSTLHNHDPPDSKKRINIIN